KNDIDRPTQGKKELDERDGPVHDGSTIGKGNARWWHNSTSRGHQRWNASKEKRKKSETPAPADFPGHYCPGNRPST
ncbi:MAG: hypothetical protein LH481_03135, partial [Burkholderiales bacterium]|nr:hypothetical protein [Burkholderiales bacterium]